MEIVVYTGVNKVANFPTPAAHVNSGDGGLANYVGLSNQGEI